MSGTLRSRAVAIAFMRACSQTVRRKTLLLQRLVIRGDFDRVQLVGVSPAERLSTRRGDLTLASRGAHFEIANADSRTVFLSANDTRRFT
jgi:hypothetical protein